MKTLRYIASLFICFVLVSCASLTDVTTHSPIAPSPSNDSAGTAISRIVSLEEAKIIASYQPQAILRQNNGSDADIQSQDDPRLNVLRRRVKNVFTLQERSTPFMYFINYEEGGFVVLSADERQIPVLAYSENGSFNERSVPDGLVLWAAKTKEDIETIRTGRRAAHPAASIEWAKLRRYIGLLPIKDKSSDVANTCPAAMSQVGPYLTTTWGQGCYYNAFIPLACNDLSYCNIAPTGCVTTAVAQLVKFWNYPAASYNWASMPNSLSGHNVAVALLMKDIAAFLNTSYGCVLPGGGGGSGALVSGIPNVLKNSFNYAFADRIVIPNNGVTHPILLTELSAGRPVICAGFTGTFLGLFPTGTGHAWVCDGFQRTVYGQPCATEHSLFHMNWGWNGGYNGWFHQNNWEATIGYNFQYHKELIVNIKPF